MAPKFGTSGLRGLVCDLTDDLITDYAQAFLRACPHGGHVHIGRDLRASSPTLARRVCDTVTEHGIPVTDHGVLPTPALALTAMAQSHAAIMITGSHIPADRNGLKFYRPDGEISKQDEVAILAALGHAHAQNVKPAPCNESRQALEAYQDRYVAAFGAGALRGLRIGVYEHSSVARDVLATTLSALGAEVIRLARSEVFVPVDTEALDPAMKAQLSGWCRTHSFDAVVSTDGDGDRPMVTDATGRIVPGDVLGPLTALSLGADTLCTPVSSNSLVDEMDAFRRVTRTRIGSPYVIAAMQAEPSGRVAGYEANGGFLLGFDAEGPTGILSRLMTRDSLLPIVAVLAMVQARSMSLEKIVDALPRRFTAADRLERVSNEAARAFVIHLAEDAEARAGFFTGQPEETGLDLTDGLRVHFSDQTVIHLRPSGNAPELRCYAEATCPEAAMELVQKTLSQIEQTLR